MIPEYRVEQINNLKQADWVSACYLVKPDKLQLRESIKIYGILTPIVVNKNNTVIDGYNRIDIATSLGMKEVPVVTVDAEGPEEVLLHIDINRYRGVVVAKFLSDLIQDLIEFENYDPEDLRIRMKLTSEEFEILSEGSLVKMRKIKQHSYSPAWVPIESSSGDNIQIERPTGHKEQV